MSSSTRRLEAINSRRVECACIAEEVDQDLLDLHAVDQDQIMSRVQVEADPDILLARAGEPKPPLPRSALTAAQRLISYPRHCSLLSR